MRRGMFGADGLRRHLRVRAAGPQVALPGSSPRPYGGYFDEVVDTLTAVLGEHGFDAAVERVVVYRDELTLEVRREQLPAVAQALRDDPACGSSCASASAACTTRRTPAASCTRCTR